MGVRGRHLQHDFGVLVEVRVFAVSEEARIDGARRSGRADDAADVTRADGNGYQPAGERETIAGDQGLPRAPSSFPNACAESSPMSSGAAML